MGKDKKKFSDYFGKGAFFMLGVFVVSLIVIGVHAFAPPGQLPDVDMNYIDPNSPLVGILNGSNVNNTVSVNMSDILDLIKASQSSSSGVVGEAASGGAYTLFGSWNMVPGCPDGYAEAYGYTNGISCLITGQIITGGSQNPCVVCTPSSSYTKNKKRIFLTSRFYDGNLGGEAGADAKCQERADAVELGGTFKAWLLDGTHEQYIYNKFNDTTYVNMYGGIAIFTFMDENGDPNGWKDLGAGVGFDEYKRLIPIGFSSNPFTGLDIDGKTDSSNCMGFTNNNIGNQGKVYSATNIVYSYSTIWSQSYDRTCDQKGSLICVEI